MEDLDYWRLCDELSVIQAALLTVGVDPSSAEGSNCENWKPEERPKGYEAAKTAIANALRKGTVTGYLVQEYDFDYNGNRSGFVEGSIDIPASRVDVSSLKQMLAGRGVTTGFFFPAEPETADYLDQNHPRYSPKLAAAVRAWQEVPDPQGKTPKQALEKWLRAHAARFGLIDDEGNPTNQAMSECSTVANWQTAGGAPKTPGG